MPTIAKGKQYNKYEYMHCGIKKMNTKGEVQWRTENGYIYKTTMRNIKEQLDLSAKKLKEGIGFWMSKLAYPNEPQFKFHRPKLSPPLEVQKNLLVYLNVLLTKEELQYTSTRMY